MKEKSQAVLVASVTEIGQGFAKICEKNGQEAIIKPAFCRQPIYGGGNRVIGFQVRSMNAPADLKEGDLVLFKRNHLCEVEADAWYRVRRYNDDIRAHSAHLRVGQTKTSQPVVAPAPTMVAAQSPKVIVRNGHEVVAPSRYFRKNHQVSGPLEGTLGAVVDEAVAATK